MVKRYVVLTGSALAAVAAALASVTLARHARVRLASPAPLAFESTDGGSPKAARTADGKVSSGPPSMLHLDARHTNRSPFQGPTSARLAWTFDTQGPIEAAPAMLDDGTILVPSLSGKLFGLNEGGELQYRVDLGDRVYGSPLVLDDDIFVGSDAHRFFGITKAGTIRFRLDTEHDVDTGAAPTPWGGIVFASGKTIYACKPDGTLLWRVQARRKCYSSPAVGDDGTVYAGSQDHQLYAVGAEGKVKWRLDLGADVDSSPAIQDDGTIVVGSDKGEVLALAPENGEVRWRTDVGGYVRGALSLGRDGTVFAGTYGPTPTVVALDPDDGRPRFRFSIPGTGAREFGVHGGPVEDAAGRIYFGTQDDHAYCLDAQGALVWKFKTGGDVDAPLVITPAGRLLVGSDDGKLYALGP